jgi:hypothetical protein
MSVMPVEGLHLGEDLLWSGRSTRGVPARLMMGEADR